MIISWTLLIIVNWAGLGLRLASGETGKMLNVNWFVVEMLQILYKLSVGRQLKLCVAIFPEALSCLIFQSKHVSNIMATVCVWFHLDGWRDARACMFACVWLCIQGYLREVVHYWFPLYFGSNPCKVRALLDLLVSFQDNRCKSAKRNCFVHYPVWFPQR